MAQVSYGMYKQVIQMYGILGKTNLRDVSSYDYFSHCRVSSRLIVVGLKSRKGFLTILDNILCGFDVLGSSDNGLRSNDGLMWEAYKH
jgi:hypothetical protein